ncbi:hypothetical protein B0H13DRAFT_2476591, partial [Mycena leptocephala]
AFPSFIIDGTHPCALSPCGRANPCLRHADARTTLSSASSARFPFELSAFFAFARRPLFGSLPTSSPPPRCACRGTSASCPIPHARVGAAARPVHACETATTATSTCTSRARTCAPVDGVDGDGDGDGCCRCRFDEDGEARSRGWECRRRWSGLASTETECRYVCTYIPPPPSGL